MRHIHMHYCTLYVKRLKRKTYNIPTVLAQ